jgi:hypothetical protein
MHDSQCCLWKITLVRNWYGPLPTFSASTLHFQSVKVLPALMIIQYVPGWKAWASTACICSHWRQYSCGTLYINKQSEAQTENCNIKKLTISNMYNLRMNILKTWNIYTALTVKYWLFSACNVKNMCYKGRNAFPTGMWHHVEARGSSEMATRRHLSVDLVAEILMVNIDYFYNSDDEKLVITLHDKWGPSFIDLYLN